MRVGLTCEFDMSICLAYATPHPQDQVETMEVWTLAYAKHMRAMLGATPRPRRARPELGAWHMPSICGVCGYGICQAYAGNVGASPPARRARPELGA